jgi:predicted ATPase
MSELIIRDWKLLQLTVDEIGPFRRRPETFSFLGETRPSDADPAGAPGPSNIYMLLAPNGRGKSTLLEAIHGLFGLMAKPVSGRFADPAAGGSAQLDIRVTLEMDRLPRSILLSLWTGAAEPLFYWEQSKLEDVAQVDDWARLNLTSGPQGVVTVDNSDDLGRLILKTIQDAIGTPPQELLGGSQSLPSILFFPADRLLAAPTEERTVSRPIDWGYSPAYQFDNDGPAWPTSIDNLFIWLDWLRDDRLSQLLAMVNEHLFEDGRKAIVPPQRDELRGYVSTENGPHPLSALSHGERALLQMFTRVFSYTTANSILLIDEIELHLHTRWMHRMFRALKALLVEHRGLSLIFSTHDRELIKAFAYETSEPGLTKGGFLIDEMQ